MAIFYIRNLTNLNKFIEYYYTNYNFHLVFGVSNIYIYIYIYLLFIIITFYHTIFLFMINYYHYS